ncbi:hypothetical protein PROFUN_16395, partial [Planoprotostelium fungivorum]
DPEGRRRFLNPKTPIGRDSESEPDVTEFPPRTLRVVSRTGYQLHKYEQRSLYSIAWRRILPYRSWNIRRIDQ